MPLIPAAMLPLAALEITSTNGVLIAQRLMDDAFKEHPRKLPVDFRSETPEAQRVVAIRADLSAVTEARRPREAAATDMTMRSEQAADSGS